jgi:hypothetical protein
VEISWATIWENSKEVFFALGSAAGFLALLKPVFQQKYDRDAERCKGVISSIPESLILDIEYSTWNSRIVKESLFSPIEKVIFERERNLEPLRFSGPLAKWYIAEIDGLCSAYRGYRHFVQVPEWEPEEREEDGTHVYYWRFNKRAYEERPGVMREYAPDLAAATEQMRVMNRHLQRLQVISEMHLLEVPLARFLLHKRFKALKETKTYRALHAKLKFLRIARLQQNRR